MENDIVFPCSLTWNVWSCVRRRGESAASSPSWSFVQAAPSTDSTPKGTPLRSRKSNPQAEDQDFGREWECRSVAPDLKDGTQSDGCNCDDGHPNLAAKIFLRRPL